MKLWVFEVVKGEEVGVESGRGHPTSEVVVVIYKGRCRVDACVGQEQAQGLYSLAMYGNPIVKENKKIDR